MASNWNICAVCGYRQIEKLSFILSSECDEGLCGDCKKHNSIYKGNNVHETMSIAEYKKLPTEVLEIATVCKIHNDPYEFFCSRHDCPCCKKCLKYHNDCKGLTDINKLIKNVKTSNAFNEIEQTLMEIAENIKRISTNRQENLTSLENKKNEIEAEIKQIRTKVNHYLDKMMDDLIKELIAVEEKERSKIQKLLISLRTKEKEITQYQAKVAHIKQFASELHTYLVMTHIEKDITAEENFIQSLAKCDSTNQISILFQINKSIQQITASVLQFGNIYVSSDQSNFSIQKRKHKQAQIMVPLSTRKMENLTLTLKKRINTELTNVFGCSVLPDGRLSFSCYYRNKIKVLKPNGSKDFEIKQIGNTFDVVFISDNSIAVTSGILDEINIIDLKKKKLKKKIKVNSDNYGAVYKDGYLVYCAGGKGHQMISLRDETITKVTNIKLSDHAYVTTFGDKMFFTNPDNNSVTSCDYHGNIQWTFCNTIVLRRPFGISVDEDGNVFVIGFDTQNVIVISHNGQRFRQILSREDGLDSPQVLHYDQSTNTLLVANQSKTAWMYEVT